MAKKNILAHNSVIFDLEKKFILANPPKLAKILGVFKVKLFKIISGTQCKGIFLYNQITFCQ